MVHLFHNGHIGHRKFAEFQSMPRSFLVIWNPRRARRLVITAVTFIWFLTRVSSHVCFQIAHVVRVIVASEADVLEADGVDTWHVRAWLAMVGYLCKTLALVRAVLASHVVVAIDAGQIWKIGFVLFLFIYSFFSSYLKSSYSNDI